MSNPNPPSGRSRARWPLFAGIAALALYATFLSRHAAVVAGGADSSGYLNSARLFLEGRLQAPLRAPSELGPAATLDAMHFLPQGFFPSRERGLLNPTYPTGLPLHLAAAHAVLGPRAGTFAVLLGAAVAAVALMYRAARDLGLDRPLATAGAVTLAAFLGRHAAVVAGGADSSGYLNSARLFLEGRLQAPLRAPPELGPAASLDAMHFLPQGFFPSRERGLLNPTYPTGLPLHLAAAHAVLGPRAGTLAILIGAAVAAVALMYRAARDLGLDRPLATAGAVTLAAFPVFLFTSIQPLSDTLATAWSLAALIAGLRAGRSAGWAAASGGAFAMATLVRPTNLLFAPALLLLVGFSPRRLLAFAAGGLPGAAWLAWYNHALYGHPLASGYGNIGAAFAVHHGAPTAVHFAKWLALLLPTLLLALPFAAVARGEFRDRRLAALGLAFLAITVCYAFYEVSHEVWWCLRFILPAVPALILAGLLGAEALAQGPGARWPRSFRRAAAGVIALWAVVAATYWSPRLAVFEMRRYEQAYADGSSAALDRFSPGALVVCSAFSGSLYYYTPFAVLRSDQIGAEGFTQHAERLRVAGREIGAVLFESEEAEAFRRCPGNWTRVTRVGNVGLWRLAPP